MAESEMNLPPRRSRSILDLIGNTPMLELRRAVVARGSRGRLLAKMESMNPGGSKKDRIALEIIQSARATGVLRPGQAVVELTSGNTGAGLALVCRALGHPFVAVMSRGNTPERASQMRALGAEVVLVDQAPGGVPGRVTGDDLKRVEEEAQRLVRERAAYRVDQFHNPANVAAHELHTGPEMWDQSEGAIDVYVDMPGTAGSFTGVTRALRARNPGTRAYVVEPAGAAVLAGKPLVTPQHRIQGAGYALAPDALTLFDSSLATGYVPISDDEAIAAARFLAREEGIHAGFSSGAHLAAAWKLLEGDEAGATIAFLVCDSGLKYTSSDLFEDRDRE